MVTGLCCILIGLSMRIVTKTCPVCNVEFTGKEYPTKGERIYCSSECSSKARITHNESHKPLYGVWANMIQRSENYANYLTIAVCEEWKKYEGFRDWATANGYREGLELDRKENHLGYNPDNCRWVTFIEQRRNIGLQKRSNSAGKFKGVYPSKTPGKWKVESRMNGRAKHLGTFSSEVLAAEAYDDHVFSIDPEHAFLNFPERLRK